MGVVYATVELTNARRDDLLPMAVKVLVDSGAVHLCIPQHVANQLSLEVQDRREVRVADGRTQTVDYVGPVRVRFANRQCLVGALVLGDEALLGAIPMEDMDLVFHSNRRTVTVNPVNPVNPANPNIAASVAMRVRGAFR